jgi:Na+/H+ antiporter NhaD/arsenite permease-like protein
MSDTVNSSAESDRPVPLKLVPPAGDEIAAEFSKPLTATNPNSVTAIFVWTTAASLLLLLFLGLVALGITPVSAISAAYPVDVLAILITLDLFSIYVVQTGALDAVGLKLALLTRGRAEIAALLMGLLMFASSALLNNLAAIFVLAPVFLTLLRAMRAPPTITRTFLSLMLVLCNLGGMATPMGDFPAIMLMSSGLVGFTPYLAGAFPLAASMAMIAILSYALSIRLERARIAVEGDGARTRISLSMMQIRHRHRRPDALRAIALAFVFVGMVVAWATIPPSPWPFFMTAIVGAAAATIVAGPRHSAKALKSYDLSTIVVMAAILLIAALATVSGGVGAAAAALVEAVPGGGLWLLIALMILVAIAAGLFSAGPATAAVLPVFVTLSRGPLAENEDLLGVAFAASICAGSSMFMHSATAGMALRGEAQKAGFNDASGRTTWDWANHVQWGVVTSLSQLALSIGWIVLSATSEHSWLLRLAPLGLTVLMIGIIARAFAPGPRSVARTSGLALACIGVAVVLTALTFAVVT